MSELDGMTLLFGEDEPDLTQVQDPRMRPAPIDRPGLGGGTARRASPRDPAPVQPKSDKLDGMDLLFGDDKPKAAAEAPQEAAQPDNRSLGRRAIDYVKGREDPQYKGTRTFTTDDADTPEGRNYNFRAGRVAAGSDEAYADVIKQSLGDRFKRMERDSQGSFIVVFDGEDGPETKRYVNEPGLSPYDVERGAAQALPYVVGATGVGKLMKGAGPLLRGLGQGAAAGATSVAGDIAATPLGSEQGVDPGRAAVVTAFGAGGELAAPAIAAAWRSIFTVPGLYNKAAGQLTEKGVAAARAAGLDPADLTAEMAQSFAKTYARTGDRTMAGQTTTIGEFKIPVTQGQRWKDPAALLNEKAMRTGVFGDLAKTNMKHFDDRQEVAIAQAALGAADDAGGQTGVAPMLAPGRSPTPRNIPRPGEMGASVRTGMQEARQAAEAGEKKVWGSVEDLVPKPEAFQSLPDIISGRIGSMRVDNQITPKAYAMAQDLETFMTGKAIIDPAAPSILKQTPVRTVDEMRRRLLGTMKGTQDASDAAAAKRIYDGFNDWIDDAADKSLLSGDAQAAANLRLARDTTKELKEVFGAKDMGGQSTPGRRILQNVIDKADTPESIIAQLFGNQGFDGAPKQGSMEALQLMKRGLAKYADEATATTTWNDIRLAYWTRLVQTKPGELHTPTMLHQNIDKAMRNQGSVVQFLYSKEELRTIRNFSRAMKEIAYKDPNPSGSGVAAAFYARQFGQALLTMLTYQNGAISKVLQSILMGSGVKNVAGRVAVNTATSQAVPTSRPMLAPYTAPAGAQLER